MLPTYILQVHYLVPPLHLVRCLIVGDQVCVVNAEVSHHRCTQCEKYDQQGRQVVVQVQMLVAPLVHRNVRFNLGQIGVDLERTVEEMRP